MMSEMTTEKRSEVRIHYAFLSVIKDGPRIKTTICRLANISGYAFDDYCMKLVKHGHVTITAEGQYAITELGLKALETYTRAIAMMDGREVSAQ